MQTLKVKWQRQKVHTIPNFASQFLCAPCSLANYLPSRSMANTRCCFPRAPGSHELKKRNTSRSNGEGVLHFIWHMSYMEARYKLGVWTGTCVCGKYCTKFELLDLFYILGTLWAHILQYIETYMFRLSLLRRNGLRVTLPECHGACFHGTLQTQSDIHPKTPLMDEAEWLHA